MPASRLAIFCIVFPTYTKASVGKLGVGLSATALAAIKIKHDMCVWSNIEISPQDSEILDIDKFEKKLGEVSKNVRQIRELIRRFEICHFKYKEHLKQIKDSIQNLKSNVDPVNIGAHHISKGKEASKNDNTGRSLIGQKYLHSLMNWLGDNLENTYWINDELNTQVKKWLGDKNQNKERFVRLLIARLIWDWEGYKEFQQSGEYKELEFQICRMDICHYAFPRHLDLLLQAIGRMQSIENFEGCGSFNIEIKKYIEGQFLLLYDYIKSNIKNKLEPNEKIQLWLTASLAKVLKEQVSLTIYLPQLNEN